MDEENDRLRELLRDLLIPSVKLINAYVRGEEGNSIKWEDLDDAHESAQAVVEDSFDLQRCASCGQYYVPSLTKCGCD